MVRKDDKKRRRSTTGRELDTALEEVGEIVSEAVVEVGDAFSEIVSTVAGGLAKRKRLSPAEKLVRTAKRKRKEWLGHRNSYVSVNAGLAGINLLSAILSGHLVPWFLFPALGWGIGLAIHGLSYKQWAADNAADIAAAEAELARLPVPQAASPQSPTVAVDPRWSSLLTRCETAVAAAEASLANTDDAVLTEQTRARLRDGLDHLKRLAEGAVSLNAAVKTVLPDGREGLDVQLADLDQRIATTTDPQLADVYRENRKLLAARRDKVATLRVEHERMYARAEGFLLAVQNIQLDASRVGANGPGIDTLTEPLRHLSEEVEILRQVQTELAQIKG